MRSAKTSAGRRTPLILRCSAHVFMLACAVLAWVTTHRIAYVAGGAPHHEHEREAHTYLPVVELAALVLAGVAVVLFFGAVVRTRPSRRELLQLGGTRRLLAAYAIGPAALYVLVEFLERSLASAPPDLVLFGGIALQVAIGCITLLASRRVLGVVGAAARRLGGVRRGLRAIASRWRVRPGTRPRGVLVSAANGSRAPPTAY
jgi:hypothetical protein